MTSQEAETAAAAKQVETMGLHRFALRCPDRAGLLPGFAAFDEGRIRSGLRAWPLPWIAPRAPHANLY